MSSTASSMSSTGTLPHPDFARPPKYQGEIKALPLPAADDLDRELKTLQSWYVDELIDRGLRALVARAEPIIRELDRINTLNKIDRDLEAINQFARKLERDAAKARRSTVPTYTIRPDPVEPTPPPTDLGPFSRRLNPPFAPSRGDEFTAGGLWTEGKSRRYRSALGRLPDPATLLPRRGALVSGLAIKFGFTDRRDGKSFVESTAYGIDQGGILVPLLWTHRPEDPDAILGLARLAPAPFKSVGYTGWALLDLDRPGAGDLAQRWHYYAPLGFSTGAKEPAFGDDGAIKSWPVGELSLCTSPADATQHARFHGTYGTAKPAWTTAAERADLARRFLAEGPGALRYEWGGLF